MLCVSCLVYETGYSIRVVRIIQIIPTKKPLSAATNPNSYAIHPKKLAMFPESSFREEESDERSGVEVINLKDFNSILASNPFIKKFNIIIAYIF